MKNNLVKRSHLENSSEQLKKWKAGELPGPLCIEVGLTNACNHTCIHCDVIQFQDIKNRTFINKDKLLSFMHDFKDLGGIELYYAESGEPFLHNDLEVILQEGKDLGIRQCVSSNGIPLTHELSSKILKNLTWIRFSVNGGNADVYSKVHESPYSDFEKLKNNISDAISEREKNNLSVGLELQYLIVDKSAQSLLDIIELHKTLKTDKLIIKSPVMKDPKENFIPEELIQILMKVDGKNSIDVRWDEHLKNPDHPSLSNDWNKCNGVYFRSNLNPEGRLWMCYNHYLNDQNLFYGNILEKSFKDIWRSKFRQDLFKKVASGAAKNSQCIKGCQCTKDNLFLDEKEES